MFRLLRQFTIASLLAIVVAALVLGVLYQRLAVRDLLEIGEKSNVALTQSFANSVWPQHAEFLAGIARLNSDSIRQHPGTAELQKAVAAQMQGIRVAKVKIYSLDGRTLFSTEAAQIGEDKSGNRGFQLARQGTAVSELVHRQSFSAFEQTIFDRDLIQSYVPIRRGPVIEGVFELYYDVTDFLEDISLTRSKLTILVAVTLTLLFAVLFALVRRADRQLSQWADDRQRDEMELRRGRDELESRVAERTAELARAKDEAVAASAAKSRFLARVAHDIRMPMNGILGMTEVLLATHLNDAQRHCARTVQTSGQNLLAVINDLLDFSRLEAGQVRLEIADVELAPLADEVAELLRPRAAEKGVQLVTRIAPDLATSIRGDGERLRQVLVNLLDNAIKSTEHGTVKLRLSPGPPLAGSDRPSLEFAVSDTGCGIDALALERIFDPLCAPGEGATPRLSGNGIGLAVCRQLVEMMGGEIGANSTLGRGSTFWFRLATEQAAAETVAPSLASRAA